MPAVVGNYKRQQAIQQLKKTYSVLSQAFNRAVAEYGDSTEWDIVTPEKHIIILILIGNHIYWHQLDVILIKNVAIQS